MLSQNYPQVCCGACGARCWVEPCAVQPWAMQHAEVRCGPGSWEPGAKTRGPLVRRHLALILALITLSVTSNDYISPDLQCVSGGKWRNSAVGFSFCRNMRLAPRNFESVDTVCCVSDGILKNPRAKHVAMFLLAGTRIIESGNRLNSHNTNRYPPTHPLTFRGAF